MTVVNTEKATSKGAQLATFIKSHQGLIAESLPKHLDADRFTRLALTCLRKTPKLQQATPESFVGSLLTASALGLEPGVNDEAYLVPYDVKERGTGRVKYTECQLIIGYQGMAKMFWQHPMAKHLDARAVYAKDHFEFSYGTNARLDHRPVMTADRGEIVAYYAVAGLSNGAVEFTVLSPAEVIKLRGRDGTKGDIPDPQRWMERKTVLRQLLKLLPKATQLTYALQVDERGGRELYESNAARAISRGDGLNFVSVSEPTIDGDVVDEVTGEVLEERDADGQGGEDPAVPVPNGHSREAADQATVEANPSSRESSTAAAPPARPAPRGGNAGDVSPAAVDGEAAAGTSSPAAASAPIRQHQPEPEPEVSAPVYTPAPIRASQKPKLREQCIRLEIQANAAEKFMWFDMILGLDEPLQQVEQLNSAQAQTLIDTLTGFADHAALEAWGKNQQPLIDGEG